MLARWGRPAPSRRGSRGLQTMDPCAAARAPGIERRASLAAAQTPNAVVFGCTPMDSDRTGDRTDVWTPPPLSG